VRPRARCTLAAWAQTTYRLSQRRAARLIPVRLNTWRYQHRRDPQDALRQRLRELAGVRVRFGYRRLTVLLRREGWPVNAKRIYRLYRNEGLEVRTTPRKKLASRGRVPLPTATRSNERWSMDFVSARLADGRWFRTLTVLDLYTREALALVADRSLTGIKVATVLTQVIQQRPAPQAITVDYGGEFVSRAMDAWAYAHDVRLDFIRPGKPVENAYIESFNGRLRDECLNSHVFGSVAEAQVVLDAWREDDNHVRPHSALQDRAPVDWAEARATHVSLESRISSTATGSNARRQVAS
jgi:putative transposase